MSKILVIRDVAKHAGCDLELIIFSIGIPNWQQMIDR